VCKISRFCLPNIIKLPNYRFTGTSLQWSDISFIPLHIFVVIKQSKTTLSGKATICTGTSTCPVKALQKYMAMILENFHHGPFFLAGQFFPFNKRTITLCPTSSPAKSWAYSTVIFKVFVLWQCN